MLPHTNCNVIHCFGTCSQKMQSVLSSNKLCAGTLSVRAVTNVVWVTQYYTELQFPGYYC